MGAARSFLLAGVIAVSAAALVGRQNHSITGPAPVGAAGRAPIGATGRAPVGAAGPAPVGGLGNLTGGHFNGGRSGSGRGSYGGERHRHGGVYAGYVGPYFLAPTPDYEPASPYVDDSGPSGDPVADDLAARQDMLGQEIGRLNARIDELSGYREPEYAQTRQEAAPPPMPPVKLVLRDGRVLQVSNYAIMNGVFWDFSQATARKIPVANIDVAASTKATEAGGGEFPDLLP